jgi:hypothetical protein
MDSEPLTEGKSKSVRTEKKQRARLDFYLHRAGRMNRENLKLNEYKNKPV